MRLVSVSDWERNGTLRMTISAPWTASAFSAPLKVASGTCAAARSAASRARPASREPITTGTPARPSRSGQAEAERSRPADYAHGG